MSRTKQEREDLARAQEETRRTRERYARLVQAIACCFREAGLTSNDIAFIQTVRSLLVEIEQEARKGPAGLSTGKHASEMLGHDVFDAVYEMERQEQNEDVGSALDEALEQYRERHPDLSGAEIAAALRRLAEDYAEEEEEEEEEASAR